MLYDELKKNSNRIIDISNAIIEIYEKLYNAAIDDDAKTYKEYIEYLKISIEVEQKIYNEINLTCNDDNYRHFMNTLYWEIKKRNYNEEKKINITGRIENYLIYDSYKDPSLAEDGTDEENLEDNIAKISLKIQNKYITTLFNELNKEISIENNEYIKNQLIYSKYITIYTNRYIEQQLLNNKKIKPYDNVIEILLNHDHEEEFIKNIYSDYVLETFNITINNLLNITNNALKEKFLFQKLCILNLKSCLKLLEIIDIKNLYDNFHKGFLSDEVFDIKKITSTNSIEKIKETFKEVLEEKQNTNKKFIKATNKDH